MHGIRLRQLELIVQYKFSKYNNGNHDSGRPAKIDKNSLDRIKENDENAAANELRPKILSRCWSPGMSILRKVQKLEKPEWHLLFFSFSHLEASSEVQVVMNLLFFLSHTVLSSLQQSYIFIHLTKRVVLLSAMPMIWKIEKYSP